jgi:hypothetical protein
MHQLLTGQKAIELLIHCGYGVSIWTRSPRSVPGARCFAGAAQLREFAARCNVVVCLVPLTPETRWDKAVLPSTVATVFLSLFWKGVANWRNPAAHGCLLSCWAVICHQAAPVKVVAACCRCYPWATLLVLASVAVLRRGYTAA